MLKHAAMAAVAAAALSASPAMAATTINYIGGTTINLGPTGPGEEAGNFTFVVSGDGTFTATYTFTNFNFDPAKGTSTATFSSTDADVITFTGASIDGMAGVLDIVNSEEMNAASVYVWQSPLALGSHTLQFTGNFTPNGNGFATIGGTLTLNAVPEPATWALFILGFGAIGATLRRRSSAVRVSKAKLNFA